MELIVKVSIGYPYPSEIRPLKHEDVPDIMTLGRGSYATDMDIDLHHAAVNILVGNFTSIAHGVTACLRQDEHDYRSAAMFPMDMLDLTDAERGREINHIRKMRFGGQRDQIIIGSDVWIGRGAVIMGGVHIGNGAIVGAHAVVAKDVPPYAIVVGNPARVIKYRFPEETVQKLLGIKWWHWPVERVKSLADTEDVETFVNTHYVPVSRMEDDASKLIRKMKAEGKTVCIFSPVAGTSDEEACRHVLEQYIRDFQAGDPIALFIEIEGDGNLVQPILDEVGRGKTNLPGILFYKKSGEVPLSILQNADYLITTKNFRSLVYMDYGADYGVKRLYAWSEDVFGRMRGGRCWKENRRILRHHIGGEANAIV